MSMVPRRSKSKSSAAITNTKNSDLTNMIKDMLLVQSDFNKKFHFDTKKLEDLRDVIDKHVMDQKIDNPPDRENIEDLITVINQLLGFCAQYSQIKPLLDPLKSLLGDSEIDRAVDKLIKWVRDHWDMLFTDIAKLLDDINCAGLLEIQERMKKLHNEYFNSENFTKSRNDMVVETKQALNILKQKVVALEELERLTKTKHAIVQGKGIPNNKNFVDAVQEFMSVISKSTGGQVDVLTILKTAMATQILDTTEEQKREGRIGVVDAILDIGKQAKNMTKRMVPMTPDTGTGEVVDITDSLIQGPDEDGPLMIKQTSADPLPPPQRTLGRGEPMLPMVQRSRNGPSRNWPIVPPPDTVALSNTPPISRPPPPLRPNEQPRGRQLLNNSQEKKRDGSPDSVMALN